jgi:hypothetical protein
MVVCGRCFAHAARTTRLFTLVTHVWFAPPSVSWLIGFSGLGACLHAQLVHALDTSFLSALYCMNAGPSSPPPMPSLIRFGIRFRSGWM